MLVCTKITERKLSTGKGYNFREAGKNPEEDLQPILCEEVEITIAALKKG